MSDKQNYKQLFIDIAKTRGYLIHEPSRLQKNSNIDIIIEGHNNKVASKVTIDIKKKNGKSGNKWVWIEYQTSRGKQGWIYGKAQFIVFETNNSFIFVNRSKLFNWLASNETIRWDMPFVDKAWSAKYRLYRRPKTLETITQIKVDDLLLVEGAQVWQKL